MKKMKFKSTCLELLLALLTEIRSWRWRKQILHQVYFWFRLIMIYQKIFQREKWCLPWKTIQVIMFLTNQWNSDNSGSHNTSLLLTSKWILFPHLYITQKRKAKTYTFTTHAQIHLLDKISIIDNLKLDIWSVVDHLVSI